MVCLWQWHHIPCLVGSLSKQFQHVQSVTFCLCPEQLSQLGEAPELQEAGSGCHHRSCCLCYLLHQTWSRLGSGCCPCAVRSLRSATRILGVTGRDKRHWSTDRLPILSLNVWVGSFWMLIGHCFLAHCLNNMKSCSEASQNYISWSKVFSHRTALDTQVPAMTQSMSCGRYKPFKLVAAGPARPQLVGTKKPGRLLLEVSRLPPSLKVGSSSLAHDTLTCILSHTWD